MAIINGKYKEYKLENGLVVALQNTPTQTVAAKLRINFGSSHEKEGEEGLAHYLEHCLVTGGSKKYDPNLADEIRCSFGYFNAATNIGRTFFIGQMLSEDLVSWMDYVSDHVLRPRFDLERINGERGRVLREISDEKSSPMYQGGLLFDKLFYRGHPKEGNNIGKEDVVSNASQEVMSKFHSVGYHPNNMDLIIVGGLPGNVEDIVKNYFGEASSGRNTRIIFPELGPLTSKDVLRIHAPEMLNRDSPDESSAHVFLYFSGPANGDEDEYATKIMNHVLGGDTNSFLFQNVGLKKGLAYRTGSTSNGDYNCGEIGIQATVHSRKIDESIETIFEEIDRMKTQKLTDERINRVKKMIKYSFAKTFESNDGHISAIEAKLDEGLVPSEIIAHYNEVTPESVMEAANKYLPDKEDGKYVLYIRSPFEE